MPPGLPVAGREIHGSDDVVRVRRPVRLPSDSRSLSSLGGIAQRLEEPSLIRRQALGLLRGGRGLAESEIDRLERLAGLEIHHDQLAASVQDESAVDLPLDGAFRCARAGHPSKRPIRLEHDQVAVPRDGHARAVPVPESVTDEGEPLLRREDSRIAGRGIDLQSLAFLGLADPAIEDESAVGRPARPFGKRPEPGGVRHRRGEIERGRLGVDRRDDDRPEDGGEQAGAGSGHDGFLHAARCRT